MESICPTCGKSFYISPPKVKRGMGKHCSINRDNYTCIWCDYKGNNLQADHIKPFALYPELRFVIDNGRTLYVECHKKTDTYGKIYSS